MTSTVAFSILSCCSTGGTKKTLPGVSLSTDSQGDVRFASMLERVQERAGPLDADTVEAVTFTSTASGPVDQFDQGVKLSDILA